MKKFQNFLLLMLLALSMNTYAQPFVQFTAQSATVDCGTDDVVIDIDIQNFTDVISWQYTVTWDHTVMTLTTPNIENLMVLPSILPGTAGLANGHLTLSWFSTGGPMGTTVGDGSIMRLTFDVIGNASQTSPIAFTSDVTSINIAQYGMQLTSSQYVLADGLLTITDTEAPMITCPTDMTVDTGGGTTAQVTGAAAMATDNCEIDFISYDLSAPTIGVGTGDVSNNVNFAVGTTTVTYTASDFGGNTDACNFDVTVTNNNAPTVLTISIDNLTLDCETNTASVDIVADNFTDLRAAQFTVKWTPGLLEYIDTTNLVFPTGIVFGSSNIASGELLFSWTDATGTGQSLGNGTTIFTINFNLNVTAGITLPITFIENTGLPTQFTSVTSFPFPLTTNEYELNNGSITLVDTEDPTISCPNNVTVISSNGTDAVVTGIAPASAMDNCGIMDTTYTLSGGLGTGTGDASGLTFPLGTTTVEYTVTDFGGNQAICSFDVTVVDPGQITVKIDSTEVSCDMSTVTVGFSVENFVDVQGIQFTFQWDPTQLEYSSIIANNLTPSGNFGLGQATNGLVTFSWFGTATTFQNGDNIIELEFNILNNTPGNSVDFIFLSAPTPYVVITASSFPNSVPTADISSIMGNVTIVDNEAPMITCPADVTIQSNGLANTPVSNIGATAMDNCGTPAITYEIMTSTPITGTGDASGNLFPIGTTTVNYTATDEGGNTDMCSFTVTVVEADPITVIIDSVEVSCDMSTVVVGFSVENFVDVRSLQFTFEWDASQLEYASIIADNFTPNGSFGLNDAANGVITFSWFGNATTFQNGDNIIELEFNILNNTVGNSVDFNFINAPTPYDIVTASSFPNSLPSAAIASVMGNVTIVDNEAPILTCPADLTVQSNGMSSVVVMNIAATATDNCGTPAVTYEVGTVPPITGNADASGISFPVGTTTVTYTATDEGGNTDVCSFTVTVQSDPLMIECPLNFTQNTDQGVCGADLPSFPINITSDPNNVSSIAYAITGTTPNTTGTGNIPPMTYSVGITTVTYTVMDNAGATETCSFTVTINDTEAPVFANVPADVTIECDEMEPTDIPTATDACDGMVMVIETPITNIINPGMVEKKRIFSAIDGNNNIALDSQVITIVDTTPPTVNCPADITMEATSTGGVCESMVTWTIPVATDNCDTDVMTLSNPASGTVFGVGVHEVTIFGVDDAGNLDSCKFNVTITDSTPPMLTCPADITVSSGSACFISVPFDLPTVTDNCDNNILPTSVPASGSNFSIGTTPVTFTATDASGNTSTCTFNVTVQDTELPSISCSPDITVSANGSSSPNTFLDTIIQVGCDSAILEFALPLGADNCSLLPTVTQTAGLPSGSTFGVGTHVMEFTVVDESNNVNTCSFEITVNPFVALSITALQDTLCINESTQLFVGQTAIPGATYTWTGPNGAIPSIFNPIINNVTMADSGTYTVMVDDQVGGCSGMATIDLVVENGPDITIISEAVNCISGPTDVQVTATNVGSIDVVSWTWINPNGTEIGDAPILIIEDATEDSSGVYTLEALGTNGCTSIIPTMVTITDAPETPLLTSECGGFLCAFENCTLSILSLPPDVDSVVWTATGQGPGLPADVTTNQITIQPTAVGIHNYTLTVYSDGCTSSESIPIQVSQAANVDPDFFEVPFQGALSNFDVTENDTLFGSLPGTYTINVTTDVVNGTLVNNEDGTFSYTPNEGYFGNDQFIYEICIECNGMTECRWAIVTLDVTSDECLVPTVLTPNGDGLNDAWQITCIGDFPDNEVIILNRWGDVIFEATGYNNDWEGTYNNQDVPDGTYFYVFKKNASDDDPQKGTITISR